jgi:hypothetical protein
MKENKELAKECFNYHLKLKENLGFHHTSWITGEGPPDYYLEADAHEFAVQVSVLEGRPDTEGAPFFEKGSDPSDASPREREVVERIRSAAAACGMRGTYGMALSSPPGGLSDATMQEIQEKALRYIENTQEASALLPGRVYDDDGVPVASIKKCAKRPHSVEVVRFPSLYYFASEERGDEAHTAIVRALSGAERALSESPAAKTSLPAVLLLLDTWLHGRKEIYRLFMSASELRKYWHSIFVVEATNKGCFPLREHERKWESLARSEGNQHNPSASPATSALI